MTYRSSVTTLRQSFTRLEAAADAADWVGSDELSDLSEAETANSVAVLNALLAEDLVEPARDDEIAALRSTVISDELRIIDADLDDRWRGALFSLHPR